MKVFVATTATQGARPSDENRCVEGELVELIVPCESGAVDPYGKCPSGRVFRGLGSDGYTTTARVREVPGLTPARLTNALLAGRGVDADAPSRRELASAWAASKVITQKASVFAVDQIVERRGWAIQVRKKTRRAVKK